MTRVPAKDYRPLDLAAQPENACSATALWELSRINVKLGDTSIDITLEQARNLLCSINTAIIDYLDTELGVEDYFEKEPKDGN